MRAILNDLSDRPIRFVLVGPGRISKNYFEAIDKHAGQAELVAVYDTSRWMRLSPSAGAKGWGAISSPEIRAFQGE